MVVRMRETRVLVKGLHDIVSLLQGREYDLPHEFAKHLILDKRAEYRPGRIKRFAPKEVGVPRRYARRFGVRRFMAVTAAQLQAMERAKRYAAEKRKREEARVITLD